MASDVINECSRLPHGFSERVGIGGQCVVRAGLPKQEAVNTRPRVTSFHFNTALAVPQRKIAKNSCIMFYKQPMLQQAHRGLTEYRYCDDMKMKKVLGGNGIR